MPAAGAAWLAAIENRLPAALKPHARGLLLAGALVLAVALAAWFVPLGGGGPSALGAAGIDGRAPEVPPPEDLAAFLDNRRWGGVSLREVEQRVAEEARREAAARRGERADGADSPAARALAELGYVGLVVADDGRTVLITLPDNTVARLRPGDELADGRTLAAVTGNSITLRSAEGEEVLELFPRFHDVPARDEGP